LLALCVDEPRAAHKDVVLTIREVPQASPQKLNILLAEDNAVNRVLAQKLLQKQGHTVTSVNNGIEAVQLWEQNQSRQFDIILMDVQMPEMDGLQAAARIRERELGTGAHIPIIAVTAHAMKGDRSTLGIARQIRPTPRRTRNCSRPRAATRAVQSNPRKTRRRSRAPTPVNKT
jgi:CheY-like chemotaxis protein